jgi:hypothetical protein
MRMWAVLFMTMIALALGACSRQETDEAARKAGKTAHKVATETEKAAKKAGRELKEAAQEAQKGWNDGAREDGAKSKGKN